MQKHQGEIGMLGRLYRGVAGRQCYDIKNLCCSLYNCDFENNKHPLLESEFNCVVVYYTFF